VTHWPYPRILAHRGGGTLAPENTLGAIRLGAEMGFKGVEFDVMLAGDGTPVLMHDRTLKRTTRARGEVAHTSYAELARLDAGSWHGKGWHGERIPRFEDAAHLCRSLGLWVNVEIKPAYGFERFGIPPAVTVNVRQLLVQFAGGWRASRPAWQDIADGQDVAAVHRLAGAAERAVEAPTANDSRARRSIARFRFPDALWARLVYDVLLAVGRGGDPATTVEVLVPIYFARVASLVVESRRLGPDQTEALVDRQVRAFMAAKPRLVARWKTEVASRPGADDGR